MKSLKKLFILGPGPSSSHTIGPFLACEDLKKELKDKEVSNIEVILYSSLALTGVGHLTDKIILDSLKDYKVEVKFDTTTKTLHPNTFVVNVFLNEKKILTHTYYSIGGGEIKKDTLLDEKVLEDVYPINTFNEIKECLKETNVNDLYRIVEYFDDEDIFDYGKKLLTYSFSLIEKGLNAEGFLPGSLKLQKVAKKIYQNASTSPSSAKTPLFLSAYAYSLSESNASGEIIVTSPTCGSCGVLPAILYYLYKNEAMPFEKLVKAYLVGGLIGNIIKTNASISGAVHGCQAEIGTASSMAAAAICYAKGLNIYQIEYASEVAMEHFLGLTCDPIKGYVQIPCIERNAMATIHAFSSYLFALEIAPVRKNFVSFDEVVLTMKLTGNALSREYKETSLGGLATTVKDKK